MKKILAIDLGRNWMRWAITSECLDVVKSGKLEVMSVEDRNAFFSPLIELSQIYKNEVEGIALTMPGIIDTEKGIAYSGGVYTWVRNEPLAEKIKNVTGLKTIILNDAKSAALAEIGYGSLKKVEHGVMLMILGTGIGGAIIHDGKIFNGAHFGAGELSYMTDCYQRTENNDDMFAMGCSINGLVKLVQEQCDSQSMNLLKIMFGLNRNILEIQEGVKLYCQRLANYIFNIQCIVDASVFVISGNITNEPLFMKMIQNAVKERFQKDRYGNIFCPEIKEATFHEDSRKYGAIDEFLELQKKGCI